MSTAADNLTTGISFLTAADNRYASAAERLALVKPTPVILGGLTLPPGNEAARCEQILVMLKDYAKRPTKVRPLSLAVFGPPGSGKSHAVRELLGAAQDYAAETVVNLSQLTAPSQLAATFARRPDRRDKGRTKVIFIDEFDAPLDGVALGWLKWFLAPMQDGEFFRDGEPIEIGKAVLIFAGGTAPCFEEFLQHARLRGEAFKSQKVPDFVSRLHGFMDIEGINTPDPIRPIRRALVLDRLLRQRAPKLEDEDSKALRASEPCLKALLDSQYFVHGVRSMEALLDMSTLSNATFFDEKQLPRDLELRKLHLSHGPFDGKIVGISAGISDDPAVGFLRELTRTLLRQGVMLAYGGDMWPNGTLDAIVEEAKAMAGSLLHNRGDVEANKRVRNFLAFPSYLNPKLEPNLTRAKDSVQFLRIQPLSDPEIERFKIPTDRWFPALKIAGFSDPPHETSHHLAWAISLFRMRARMISDSNALIVVGGKSGNDQSWGRFPGIAEEVMLAIAMKRPVYVLGGRGGAAREVGRLLGLDESIVDVQSCLKHCDPKFEELLTANSTAFSLPGHPDLPNSAAAMQTFLFDRALGTRCWTWNGLSPEENRVLFTTPINEKSWGNCVPLILRGLSRLEWK